MLCQPDTIYLIFHAIKIYGVYQFENQKRAGCQQIGNFSLQIYFFESSMINYALKFNDKFHKIKNEKLTGVDDNTFRTANYYFQVVFQTSRRKFFILPAVNSSLPDIIFSHLTGITLGNTLSGIRLIEF